jgi:ABC-type nitrate/sulfonate/bicarbonate transport system substrate-binding protein
MIRNIGKATAIAALAAGLYAAPAVALERVNVAIGQRGIWDTLATVFAKDLGFFEKLGLDVRHIKTRGGAETARVVMTGDMNFGMDIGVLGAIGAYSKGGPIRIVSSQMIGTADLFWYVRSDSKLKTVNDISGAQIGYSRPGSGTNMTLLTLAAYLKLTPKLVSTGGIGGTRTQVMSGQVDAGWSVAPFGLDLVQKGEARILFKGDIVKPLANVSIRVNIVNSDWLAKNRATARKFMQGYYQGLKWMYGPGKAEATKRFAKFNKLSMAVAKDAVAFYKLDYNALAPIRDLDKAIELALQYKRIKKPLTAAQKAELVQIVYDPNK